MRNRIAALLLVAGLTCAGLWLWSVCREKVSQEWSNREFERQERAPQQPSVAEPKPPEFAMVGRLSVPRLGVQAIIREGESDKTLSVALGHIPGTAMPGERGNVAVAGHRDTLFRGLKDVHQGDRVEFETPRSQKFTYEVEKLFVVRPTDVYVLRAASYNELTLVTCYPFNYIGSAPYRFIVQAREVGQTTTPEPVRLVPVRATQPRPPRRRMKAIPYNPALVYRAAAGGRR
jgi:sortase A